MEVLVFLLIVLAIFALSAIKVVRQAEVCIIERLGKFKGIAQAGVTVIFPFIDKIRAKISLKEQTMDVPPQSVITKDNVTIIIDTVVFYQITDPKRAIYEIENLQKSIGYLAITTIRDIVGKMDLDSTFSSRENINSQLTLSLDEATDRWGCKVNRVEIKDINPPKDIRDAMEKQMNAERTKRALILQAEGERQSAITIAEGNKQSRILNAEAEKEANIKIAEGYKEAKILEAIGEAQSIKEVAEAKAREIELVYGAITNANPSEKLVAIKSLEALEKISNGAANKVFIPFEATNTLSAIGSIKEILKG